MEILFQGKEAFGHPGMPPRWTRSEKEGVGTAYNTASRIWFTLSHGILNEVYFPTVDSPQIRDLEYLISDGAQLFHEEKRDLITESEYIDAHALGYRIIQSDPAGRYRLVKEIITDPHLSCVLIHTRLEGEEAFLKKLHLYVLLAPHLAVGGGGNTAAKARVAGRDLLVAFKDGVYLALGATVPFRRTSCGFVGASDGWTDLRDNFQMDWEFDFARDGNVAVMGEVDLSETRSFTLGLGFGFALHGAITTLLQSLGGSYEKQQQRYREQWHRICGDTLPLDTHSGDKGRLYRISHSLLLAHEDKTYPGALIASMSIPWGEVHGDDDGLGGYHLVWTRDLCQSVTALLASGNRETPYRALIYLAASQRPDGGFYQNFWINGAPYWQGIQLDGVAFPVLLAWRLQALGGLKDFDPYPMVMKAAQYLIRQGPATPQERWEENSGYSPSTLAANIAALICAAAFARLHRQEKEAAFFEAYADFLESHLEAWTVTTQGTLVPGISRHFIRIHPVDPKEPRPHEDPNVGRIILSNRPPGSQYEFAAKEIVDAGFLELVRYGIRKPDDPLIEDSLKVVDAVLRVETPVGPSWRRYNHDGFGQRADGGPYVGSGQGRAWPLLTGERAHYELAAGRKVERYIRAIERFASPGGMLPEQIWDAPDRPEWGMYFGRPTGAAMPLMWAHAEYIKLLRSVHDGVVFDLLPPVAARYREGKGRKELEVWKLNRQVGAVAAGKTLRILAHTPFRIRWSSDEWKTARDTEADRLGVEIAFVDLPIPRHQTAPIRFTFYWLKEAHWEGKDFSVEVAAPHHADS
ncbi:MAG: glucan 1,4-alpha-glucosidase [Nitrospirae bacterium]|nr:glucan 1,4-alpha-glucosidase [Candidatus Manganitrophaceae bacterium]